MPSLYVLDGTGNRNGAAFVNFRRLQAVIDREPEHKRKPRGQTSLHLVDALDEPLVFDRLVLQSVFECLVRRFHVEFCDVVWPIRFGTGALLGDALDAVTYLRPSIGMDRML